MNFPTPKQSFSKLVTLIGLGAEEAPPPTDAPEKTQAEHEGTLKSASTVAATESQRPNCEQVQTIAPAPDPQIQAPQSSPLDEKARGQLRDIQKFASWSGPDGDRLLKGVTAAFNEAYPGYENEIEQAVARGRMELELSDRAYKIASQRGGAAHELEELRQLAAKRGIPSTRVQKQIDRGHACFQRWKGGKAKRRDGTPLSQVVPRSKIASVKQFPKQSLAPRRDISKIAPGLHANDLRALSPAPHWRVLIDETGDEFGPEAGLTRSRRVGRFVALALPVIGESLLKPLPDKWHAVDCSDDTQIDEVFQAVMDAEVGLLGICVTGLPPTPGERWADGVGLLIDWVVRLLPLSGATRVEVMIENRGVFGAGQSWQLVARESLRRLALAFPTRAGLLNLEISVIGKNGSPFNGYVDALAFTWAGTSDSSRERLNRSGLRRTCLLEQDAREIVYAWDAFAQGVELPPRTWWDLIVSDDASDPASILASFLDVVGDECQADQRRWAVFLQQTRQQMAYGAVELRRLAAAVNWLQRFQPVGAVIPPLLRLSWLTVQLAKANHLGIAESEWAAELERLAPGLIEEAAPLVCQADLHLAVACTNRFAFENARSVLQRWQDMPPAVPGLQSWGQVISSLGQQAAFLGVPREATRLFDSALEVFARLSDPANRDKELAQTACYRAIAMMDDEGSLAEQVRAAIQKVTGPLNEAATLLATSADPVQRYSHHLLLRWLVHRGDGSLQAAYLASQAAWKVGEGHPWPLIQLYRGMLLVPEDHTAAINLALEGAEIAFSNGSGPVMRLIGACCRVVACAWGAAPWPQIKTEIDALRTALPLATERLAFLSSWTNEPGEPLTLIRKVLPFNFR